MMKIGSNYTELRVEVKSRTLKSMRLKRLKRLH